MNPVQYISPFEILRRRQAQSTAAVAEVLSTPANMSPNEALRRLRQTVADAPAEPRGPTEAERILALPEWDPKTFKVDLTAEFRAPGGTMTLSPIQSLALYWMREANGLLAPLAVGAGKTLVTLLAGPAMHAKRPCLLIPSDMQSPIRREIEKMRRHWRLPKIATLDEALRGSSKGELRILPYSQLSVARSTDILDRFMPDLIIADEAQNLRYATSARTKRVIRYFKSYPDTRFVALSGTLTSKGLRDYAHLAELALRENAPLPLLLVDLIAWANVLDADAVSRVQDIDQFKQFCPDLDELAEIEIERALGEIAAGTDEGRTFQRTDGAKPAKALKRVARNAFRERFTTTRGVVATTEGSVQCRLVLRERALSVPDEIFQALGELRETWCRPDGEELVLALEKWRCESQLSQGFYYRWVWPGGVVDTEWLMHRANWHRIVRTVLQWSLVGLDSPLLVVRAVMDHRLDQFPLDAYTQKALLDAWTRWSEVKHRPKPPTETVWLDDYMIRDALVWHKEHPCGLIWFDDLAVERELRHRGIETYGAGTDPPEDGRGMALSINSFKTGRNFQGDVNCGIRGNSENLILAWQSSGQAMEQLLGRTHRQGQAADEVVADYYNHTDSASEAIARSRNHAEYLQQSQGSKQKLLYADWLTLDPG